MVEKPSSLVANPAAQSAALPETAAALARLVDQPVCQLAGDGTITAVNPALARLLGWSEAMVGQPFAAYVHALDYPRLAGDDFAGTTGEVRMRSGDGGYGYVRWHGLPTPSGRLLVGTPQQVSAAGEPAWTRPSYERAELMVQVAQLGTWYYDIHLDKLVWNDTLRAHFGLPPSARVDLNTFVAHLHPEDREATLAAFERTRGGAPLFDAEYRVHGGDGIERIVHAIGRPCRDAHGTISHIDGVTFDVTERRRGEVAMRQAVEVRDNFLAIASHELRTPLTGTLLHLSILERRLAQGDNPRAVRDFLGKLHQQLRRLTRLVDDMIDVSRISSDSLRMAPRRLELAGLVERVLGDTTTTLTRAKCPVVRDLGAGIYAFADDDRLRQALAHVLTNAASYAPNAPIEVSLTRTGAEALIEVRDFGRGLATQDLGRIFGKFERAISRSEVSGMGLGLYISKHILRALNGDLRVHSTPGRGATFTLVLPASL